MSPVNSMCARCGGAHPTDAHNLAAQPVGNQYCGTCRRWHPVGQHITLTTYVSDNTLPCPDCNISHAPGQCPTDGMLVPGESLSRLNLNLNTFSGGLTVPVDRIDQDQLAKFVDSRIAKLADRLDEVREALRSGNTRFGTKMLDAIVDEMKKEKS